MPRQSKTRQLVSDRVRFLYSPKRHVLQRFALQASHTRKSGISSMIMLCATTVNRLWHNRHNKAFENHSHSFSLALSALCVTSSDLEVGHE